MPKFINHDALSADLFNTGHSTGTGLLASWKDTLTNTTPLLEILVRRMEKDWMALPVKGRKPWNAKECDSCMDYSGITSLQLPHDSATVF